MSLDLLFVDSAQKRHSISSTSVKEFLETCLSLPSKAGLLCAGILLGMKTFQARWTQRGIHAEYHASVRNNPKKMSLGLLTTLELFLKLDLYVQLLKISLHFSLHPRRGSLERHRFEKHLAYWQDTTFRNAGGTWMIVP